MADPRTTATARVTFTVEMPAQSNWGSDCKMDQIYKQAGEETQRTLENLIMKNGGRVIGQPKVVAVLTERT